MQLIFTGLTLYIIFIYSSICAETQSPNSGIENSHLEAYCDSCIVNQRSDCPDSLNELAGRYFETADQQYNKDLAKFRGNLKNWNTFHIGPKPIRPNGEYEKTISMYTKLITTYPNYPFIWKAYWRLGWYSTEFGFHKKAKEYYKTLLEKNPDSTIISAALFRLGDYEFNDSNYENALMYYEKISKFKKTNNDVYVISEFRQGEIYRLSKMFEKAIIQFHNYLNETSQSELTGNLHDEAISLLADCYSEDSCGIQKALAYFKTNGDKKYREKLIFTIGEKSFQKHDYLKASENLETARKIFPFSTYGSEARDMINKAKIKLQK